MGLELLNGKERLVAVSAAGSYQRPVLTMLFIKPFPLMRDKSYLVCTANHKWFHTLIYIM